MLKPFPSSADPARVTCWPKWQAGLILTSNRVSYPRVRIFPRASQQCSEVSPSTSVDPAQCRSDEILPSSEFISTLRDAAELSRTGVTSPSSPWNSIGCKATLLARNCENLFKEYFIFIPAGSNAEASTSWLCEALAALVQPDSKFFPWKWGAKIHYR